MSNEEKTGLLRRDKQYVKFVQLLRKAETDGRVDGKWMCGLCGMKFNTRNDAEGCCKVTVA